MQSSMVNSYIQCARCTGGLQSPLRHQHVSAFDCVYCIPVVYHLRCVLCMQVACDLVCVYLRSSCYVCRVVLSFSVCTVHVYMYF